MIVIIPHPTEELILIREQKKMISDIFEKGKIIYAHLPLWIPTAFETVEQAKNEIDGITINTPQYDENKECIVCPVEIKTKDGKVLESKLDFIHGLPRHYAKQSDEAINTNEKVFPLAVKIFRLGICTSPKPDVFELSSSVWKKIT